MSFDRRMFPLFLVNHIKLLEYCFDRVITIYCSKASYVVQYFATCGEDVLLTAQWISFSILKQVERFILCLSLTLCQGANHI